jgi:hypothetical protein
VPTASEGWVLAQMSSPKYENYFTLLYLFLEFYILCSYAIFHILDSVIKNPFSWHTLGLTFFSSGVYNGRGCGQAGKTLHQFCTELLAHMYIITLHQFCTELLVLVLQFIILYVFSGDAFYFVVYLITRGGVQVGKNSRFCTELPTHRYEKKF